MPFRVLIFSPAAREMEGILSSDAAFHVLSSITHEADVFHLLLLHRPDIAILDGNLPGLNCLHVLKRLKAECAAPPFVLYIGPDGKTVKAAGADAILDALSPFLCSVLKSFLPPAIPSLSRHRENIRREKAAALMQVLAMPGHLKGTAYIQEALIRLSGLPSPSLYLGKPLYADLAVHFQTTPAAVERAIRTAIESTWLTGNLAGISALFGYTVNPEKGKPTNNECMALLVQHVYLQTQQSLNALAERMEFYGAIPPHHAG